MKRLLILCLALLFLSSNAFAQNWINISNDKIMQTSLFIDGDSIKNQDGLADFWYESVDNIGMQTRVHLIVNCKGHLSLVKEAQSYDPLGRILEDITYPMIDWQPIDPNASIVQVIDFACGSTHDDPKYTTF
jgi:hypothetical protein